MREKLYNISPNVLRTWVKFKISNLWALLLMVLYLFFTLDACGQILSNQQADAHNDSSANSSVTITASKNQMSQMKALFDQCDYQHLQNPSNVVSTLLLGDS